MKNKENFTKAHKRKLNSVESGKGVSKSLNRNRYYTPLYLFLCGYVCIFAVQLLFSFYIVDGWFHFLMTPLCASI
jgi:hypothetical protein